jgi:excisionase family DNA binding protein
MNAHVLPKVAYSVAEAVHVTGIGRSRLYEEISAGRLRTIKVGRRRLILAEAVQTWLANLRTSV